MKRREFISKTGLGTIGISNLFSFDKEIFNNQKIKIRSKKSERKRTKEKRLK